MRLARGRHLRDSLSRHRPLRWLGALLTAAWVTSLWAAVGAVVALAALTSLTPLVDYRPFTVLTGSMRPALEVGSIVFNQPIKPAEARIGDIVTFPDPNNHRRMITHRVRDLRLKGGKAFMVTRGDANDAPERWNVPLDQEIGRVAYHAPKLGYAKAWVTGKVGAFGGIAIVAVWGLFALLEIWRPRRDPAAGPDTAAPAPSGAAPVGAAGEGGGS